MYGLPAQGGIFNLLPFEFINQDRIHLIGVVCTLVRVKDAAPATGRAGAPPASGRATPGTASPVRPRHLRCAGCGFSGSCRVCTRCEFETERFRGRMGYDCAPDGVDVAVDSCSSEADDAKATCVVVRVDQPQERRRGDVHRDLRGARQTDCELQTAPADRSRREARFCPLVSAP